MDPYLSYLYRKSTNPADRRSIRKLSRTMRRAR